MPESIQNIKSRIIPILKAHDVEKAGIFGSAARGELYNDIDLLIRPGKKINLIDFIKIKHALEDELGIKVDLVHYDAIKATIKDKILQDEISVI